MGQCVKKIVVSIVLFRPRFFFFFFFFVVLFITFSNSTQVVPMIALVPVGKSFQNPHLFADFYYIRRTPDVKLKFVSFNGFVGVNFGQI